MPRFLLAASVVALLLACNTAPDTARGQSLPGTQPLTWDGDLADRMVAGIDGFLLDQIEQSVGRRAAHWHRDVSSPEAYAKSVAGNRRRFREIIGAADQRVAFDALELLSTTSQPALVGRGEGFKIFAVRWPVVRGIEGEGLLLTPELHRPLADCVVIPDADQTPEMLAGLVECPPHVQIARRLADNNCRVLVPTVIDRRDTHSVTGAGRATNQPHREFVYRPAYEMGRHVIGYEVQKVLAGIDWFTKQPGGGLVPKGVCGYGEGGLLALYAAAADPRIDVCCTSGYFDSRQDLWQEPIYRNVFGLLDEFGDAELASLIAPRALIVEACRAPELDGPPPEHDGRRGAAPGRIVTPKLASVQAELQRARKLVEGLDPAPHFELVASGEDGRGPQGSEAALAAFVKQLIPEAELQAAAATPTALRREFDAEGRHLRQFRQLLEDTQVLLRESAYVREPRMADVDRSSLKSYRETIEPHRKEFYDEVIGRFDLPLAEKNVRTRQIYDEPKYTGHEVVMDVFPGVFAYGILLLPKDIRPGEKRPVVVCQHGLEGRPQDVADPKVDHRAYHRFACQLAEQGFITYAPQNPYIFRDRFRTLQRKANPLKKSLFSIIVPQHQQSTDWLAGLPMVDPQRIAFYGLSYGGKTAMRVPSLVSNYCLSICSGDFNEWIWKNVSLRSRYSYVGTIEYEMFEWNLGHTFNYAEMAALIAPRPFMVERGHNDGVAPDEQVAYEYAKVRRLYAQLGIPERTRIEFFDGPHMINGVGTFDFLHEQLRWPKK